MRIGTILIFFVACVWAYNEVTSLWIAVIDAVKTEGVIDRIEKRVEYSSSTNKKGRLGEWPVYAVYVTFTTDDKRVVTRPVQSDGASSNDIYFVGEEKLFNANFRVEKGATVPLLYHRELGDLIWFDDFWVTWAFPLFITLVVSVPLLAILVVIIIYTYISISESKQKKLVASMPPANTATLVKDIRAIFDQTDMTEMPSLELTEALVELNDRPWRWYGKHGAMTTQDLAELLRPLAIKTTKVGNSSRQRKGYRKEWFEELT